MMRLGSLALRVLVLAGVVTLAAAPSLPIRQVSQASARAQIGVEVKTALEDMSTGTEQALAITGSDAQSRNAAIPLSAQFTRSLSTYQPMRSGTESYSTALKCMTQAIYYEAANEPRLGKQAVGQVVMNRLRHPAYPNSVCGVVYEGVNQRVCQFSFTCDGALLRQPLARQWQASQAVASEVLAGKQLVEVGTATHYHADYVVPKWAYTLTKLKVIGRHIFYRFPGSAGEPSSFAARWAGRERIPEINWARFSAIGEVAEVETLRPEKTWVEGLTVTPDPKDRHAKNDVGGRIDTTKAWRLSIPDPVSEQSSYKSAIASQTGEAATASQTMDETPSSPDVLEIDQ